MGQSKGKLRNWTRVANRRTNDQFEEPLVLFLAVEEDDAVAVNDGVDVDDKLIHMGNIYTAVSYAMFRKKRCAFLAVLPRVVLSNACFWELACDKGMTPLIFATFLCIRYGDLEYAWFVEYLLEAGARNVDESLDLLRCCDSSSLAVGQAWACLSEWSKLWLPGWNPSTHLEFPKCVQRAVLAWLLANQRLTVVSRDVSFMICTFIGTRSGWFEMLNG